MNLNRALLAGHGVRDARKVADSPPRAAQPDGQPLPVHRRRLAGRHRPVQDQLQRPDQVRLRRRQGDGVPRLQGGEY